MTWTSPRTWTTGELVTAAMLNTHVRDQFNAIGDPMASYTPTLTGITLGNGTLTAKYLQAGKLVIGHVTFLAGSTTTYSATNLGFSLPVAFSTALVGTSSIGNGHVDNGAGASRRLVMVGPSGTQTANFLYEGGTVTDTTPFAFGTSSRIGFQFTYEAA